ncbi:MAG: SH3 domain-containing protein [Treponema sp.]|uniref:SH3 domain-containing protein n=1 Tax=Treponema sp. TaxID=166 RepID=UPI00298DEE6D|nr:SH3 domain-containing protein [Treponema sp.]MCQ2599945.1 SH3 domain-containing protein [Treponema sp.]
MKKLILFLSAVFFCGMSFAQIKGLVCENKVNVLNSFDPNSSEILYQLDYSDEVKIYSETGDKKSVNGILNHWYKISENSDEYINADFVYTFPCEMAVPFYNGPGKIDYNTLKVKDFKKQDDDLYFLIERNGDDEESWIKISEMEFSGNKSKNATDLIKLYVEKFNKDYFINNQSQFEIVNEGYWKGSYKAEIDGAEIVYYSKHPGKDAPYFLLGATLSQKDYEYPYGLKIGMPVKEFVKIMGGYNPSFSGYDRGGNREYFLYYPRATTYDMYVFFDDSGKVTKVKFYCGM